MSCHLLLQLRHLLLVTGWVLRFWLENPIQETVGVIWFEVLVQDTEPLTILGNLGPVSLDVLEILGKVGIAALKNLPVELRTHDRLKVDVLSPGLLGLLDNEVGRLLHGTEERADLVWILPNKALIADVQDRTETAAAELCELIDTKHLHVGFGTALRREPLLEFHHLHVLETDAGINVTFNNGLGDVHATTDSSVVRGRHAVVRGKFIDLDLAKLSNIANALSL